MLKIWRFSLFFVFALNATAQTLVLKGGTIWTSPKEEPIRQGTVVIENGRISAIGARLRVPRGAQVLDCSGQTILAGFWNSHVHFFERKWENSALVPAQELERQVEAMTSRYGFTSVFDIASTGDNTRSLRDRIEQGNLRGPRIRTTGEPIVAPGAVPSPDMLRMLGNMVSVNHEVVTAGQAAAAARAILGSRNDGIKVHLQRPISEGAILAAVEEAHRHGKPVFVHPSTRADVLAAARVGVDVLAHSTPFSAWDASVVPALLEKRIAITPTLTLWRYAMRHGRVSVQEQALQEALAQVRSWAKAGGVILFGNDLGAVEYDPSEEYELMSRAGMNFRQVLASLTTAPAERFGEASRLGRIASGYLGDLVVVDGDPTVNIRALGAIRYTIRDGRIIYQASPV
ncbi:MAG: amidohydrolase family protein [Bryobacteraceae bacterium]|nr:amidohydrolase family protein [Bryobacteraceae bacterium]